MAWEMLQLAKVCGISFLELLAVSVERMAQETSEKEKIEAIGKLQRFSKKGCRRKILTKRDGKLRITRSEVFTGSARLKCRRSQEIQTSSKPMIG